VIGNQPLDSFVLQIPCPSFCAIAITVTTWGHTTLDFSLFFFGKSDEIQFLFHFNPPMIDLLIF
jgi:hypothetical protein